MENLWLVIVCVAVLFGFLILFFLVDYLTRTKKAAEKQEQKDKPKEEAPAPQPPPTPVQEEITQEYNIHNLANDVQLLIDTDESNKPTEGEVKKLIRQTRLANTRRMRDYYESKHRGRSLDLDAIYDDTHDSQTTDGKDDLTLSQEDIRKLLALKEMMDKKS